jgi:hypothetical protein
MLYLTADVKSTNPEEVSRSLYPFAATRSLLLRGCRDSKVLTGVVDLSLSSPCQFVYQGLDHPEVEQRPAVTSEV